MNRVSILYGKRYGELIYVRVFLNRDLAERQKKIFEDYDRNNDVSGWIYFVEDEIVLETVC